MRREIAFLNGVIAIVSTVSVNSSIGTASGRPMPPRRLVAHAIKSVVGSRNRAVQTIAFNTCPREMWPSSLRRRKARLNEWVGSR
ncbi:MAG TPA: hypothetical protein VIG42_05965 [Solirubrobacteraceae bacterium]|jgi:hypothetical protein